jgi:hypothetical protein
VPSFLIPESISCILFHGSIISCQSLRRVSAIIKMLKKIFKFSGSVFVEREHLETTPCWALVAHTCNPSYSGGRDQED